MSAFAIIRKADAIHMLTDSAVYTPTEGFVRSETKVLQLPDARTALCGRGAAYPHIIMPAMLGGCRSFDDVLTELPAVMEGIVSYAHGVGREHIEASEHGWAMLNFEVTAIGWSDALGHPVAVIAGTSEAGDPRDTSKLSSLEGYERFQPFELPILCGSNMSFEEADQIVRNDDVMDIADVDPRRHGIAMMNVMRNRPTAVDGRGHHRYTVGGFVELTTITREAMTVRRVMDWPDTPGTEIRPDLDHLPPRHDPTPPMERALACLA